MVEEVDTEALDDFGERTTLALELLYRSRLYNQVLVILYSAIDTLAWSCRFDGDSNRDDFFYWVDKYMRCDDLGVTCLDLYAARCSILHSNTSESHMTRYGPSLPITYVVNPRDRKVPERMKENDLIVVELTDLINRYLKAFWAFRVDVITRPTTRDIVLPRMEEWIRFQAWSPWDEE